MIARLLRATTLSLVAAALVWWIAWAAAGQGWVGFLGALVLLNAQPIILAFEFFVLLPCLNRVDAAPKAGVRMLFKAWWLESATSHEVFGLQQPFRADRWPDALKPSWPGQRAVILVHGFFCNRGIWNRWLPRLRQEGIAHLAVTLEPPFVPLDDHAAALDAAIEQARSATGLAPVLVCHSMGGLVARAWWRAHACDAGGRVHRVVTIGSPHAGAYAARFAHAPNARQMRSGGAWLQALADDGRCDDRHRRFTCFYSNCDNISLPASTGMLDGADNRQLPGWPHVAMIHAPEVWQEVLARVREP